MPKNITKTEEISKTDPTAAAPPAVAESTAAWPSFQKVRVSENSCETVGQSHMTAKNMQKTSKIHPSATQFANMGKNMATQIPPSATQFAKYEKKHGNPNTP